MSETARRSLVLTTREPVAATFMLAKHLSDLRNQDFTGTKADKLTYRQMVVIATRYRHGREASQVEINNLLKSGENYISRMQHVSTSLNR